MNVYLIYVRDLDGEWNLSFSSISNSYISAFRDNNLHDITDVDSYIINVNEDEADFMVEKVGSDDIEYLIVT